MLAVKSIKTTIDDSFQVQFARSPSGGAGVIWAIEPSWSHENARRLAMATILFFFDKPSQHQIVEKRLRRSGHDVVGTDDLSYAAEVLDRFPIDLIVLDVASADGSALRVLESVRTDS